MAIITIGRGKGGFIAKLMTMVLFAIATTVP